MKILDKINNYINEYDYKIIITDKYINITNYKEILDFNSNKISIKSKTGITVVEGKELVISKMLEDEILIIGKFNSINLKGDA